MAVRPQNGKGPAKGPFFYWSGAIAAFWISSRENFPPRRFSQALLSKGWNSIALRGEVAVQHPSCRENAFLMT
jgi:hypothetical protein